MINILYGPPGTGKTTELMRLMKESDVPFNRIALVAFSKKAADEAKERIHTQFGVPLADLTHIQTIHSMCFHALRVNREQMMDAAKYRDFGKKSGFILTGHNKAEDGLNYSDDDFIGLEQLYRNNRKQCERELDLIDTDKFVQYMKLYKQYKSTLRFMDFTDLLEQYLKDELCENVDIAFVDEAQDLTTLQWRVVFQAFKEVDQLYIAGDDDQSIYGFQGADNDVFINLKGNTRTLERSYRLPQVLVDKAKDITSLIAHRVPKLYHGLDKEGSYNYIAQLDEIHFKPTESYYLLARINCFLKDYINWCIDNKYIFKLKGQPYVTPTEYKRFLAGEDLGDTQKMLYCYMVLDTHQSGKEPFINISTIHAVKGGEADNVVIRTDITKASMLQMNMDEDIEHRIFYVAVTRAKKNVYVMLPTRKYNYEFL